MKIKTSELTGAALDWVVAQIEGWQPYMYRINASEPPIYTIACRASMFTPAFSTDPSQAWPIIDRERIATTPLTVKVGSDIGTREWFANHEDQQDYADGPTSLIAAMRCHCRSRLGDVLDIPEELCQQQKS